MHMNRSSLLVRLVNFFTLGSWDVSKTSVEVYAVLPKAMISLEVWSGA